MLISDLNFHSKHDQNILSFHFFPELFLNSSNLIKVQTDLDYVFSKGFGGAYTYLWIYISTNDNIFAETKHKAHIVFCANKLATQNGLIHLIIKVTWKKNKQISK